MFIDLLSESGMKKKELAEYLGLEPETVTRWGDDPPHYAIVVLTLYIENRQCREFKNLLRKML